jgi:hypothetical protein
MGMERVRTHLDEDARTILDVLAEEFDRKILGFDEEGIAPFGALGRDTRLQPLRTMDLSLGCAGLWHGLLLRQLLAHGVAQRQVTGEVHRIHPRQEWCDALSLNRHRSIPFSAVLAPHVSVEGRETQSALLFGGMFCLAEQCILISRSPKATHRSGVLRSGRRHLHALARSDLCASAHSS